MSTINVLGQRMAMEGQTKAGNKPQRRFVPKLLPSSAPAPTISKPNLETVKAQAEKAQQELSKSLGRKVRFDVNEELDRIVVEVVDSATNEVIKQIPSEDVQKLQLRMKQTCALIVDEQF